MGIFVCIVFVFFCALSLAPVVNKDEYKVSRIPSDPNDSQFPGELNGAAATVARYILGVLYVKSVPECALRICTAATARRVAGFHRDLVSDILKAPGHCRHGSLFPDR